MRPAIHPDDSLEYTRQMLVYGDVRLDVYGRVAQREEPDYWKMLRVNGRGYGKTSYARKMAELQEQVQRVIDKTDELHRLVKGWRMVPPQPKVEPVDSYRWRCRPPTQMPVPGSMLWYQDQATKFLAGRPSSSGKSLDIMDLLIKAKNQARAQW